MIDDRQSSNREISMRFPSLTALAERATAVLRRFPWTLAAGAVAATAAIIATNSGEDPEWIRIAFVAALGLPLTVALTLLAEVRGWSPLARSGSLIGGVAVLLLFYRTWPGVEQPQYAIRYFQLSAALHLVVAFLPLLNNRNPTAFWQYNRRLFLGFLRAVVFSGVLFVGVAIALAALDQLFGADIPDRLYQQVWFVAALVGNTWIFLAAAPENFAALEEDSEYPKALKVFAQYILTPLVFSYLMILLAYLIKIVVGGQWPSGWIGWLVASVAVSGMLGFLLVEPLRNKPEEGWIRIYARFLFIGLIPSALMLLAAFWKRIEPYGLTEMRTLGFLLGVWLLGIAVLFATRPASSIKLIPVSLALLLLVTLYGPLSVSRLSIESQGRRLGAMLQPGAGVEGPKEASAALRFLMDHRAGSEIAARIGKPLPPIDWATVPDRGPGRDSLGTRLMALAGATYRSEGTVAMRQDGGFSFGFNGARALPVSGFDWTVRLNSEDFDVRMVDGDSVQLLPPEAGGIVRFRAGVDTLRFDLRPVAKLYRDSLAMPGVDPDRWLRAVALPGPRRAELLLQRLNGKEAADSLHIDFWNGSLLLGKFADR
jgi:hypothetical protein